MKRSQKKRKSQKRNKNDGKTLIYNSQCLYKTNIPMITDTDINNPRQIKIQNFNKWKDTLGFNDVKFDKYKDNISLNYDPYDSENAEDLKSVSVDFTQKDDFFDVHTLKLDIRKTNEKLARSNKNASKEILKKDDEINEIKLEMNEMKREMKREMKKEILKKDDEINEIKDILNKIIDKLNPLVVLSKPSCHEVFNNITERYIKEAKESLNISNYNTTKDEFNKVVKELKKNYKTINWYKVFKLRDDRNDKTHRQPLDKKEVKAAISIYESNNWKNLQPMYELSLLWLSENS